MSKSERIKFIISRSFLFNFTRKYISGQGNARIASTNSIPGPDKVISKSVNANDVTEQYYDVKIRLENERQVEKRYLELLAQARTVKDILDIEEKLGKVRQEIESKEGRLRFSTDLVDAVESSETVFIAVGTHNSVKLGIPGEELDGVYHGVSFLRDVNLGGKVDGSY